MDRDLRIINLSIGDELMNADRNHAFGWISLFEGLGAYVEELELEFDELLELAWFLLELELSREFFLVVMAAPVVATPEIALFLFGDLEVEWCRRFGEVVVSG